MSVTEATPPVQIDITLKYDDGAAPSQTLLGKKLWVQNLADWITDEQCDIDWSESLPAERYYNDYVVVVGEDMAVAEAMIVDTSTGHIAWVNPALPESAIDLTRAAATALTIAERETVNAYEPVVPESTLTEDQQNAIAWIAKGSLTVARQTAGDEFVNRVLAAGIAAVKGETL